MTKPPFEETLEPVNIGKPPGEIAPSWTDCPTSPITWWWLRRIGFRFAQAGVDCQPHMIVPVDNRMDTSLEISHSHYDQSWIVWLRSDIAHSKCRFCYMRNVKLIKELVCLIEAIKGESISHVEFDADQFADSLAREWRDCKRRYHEYANDARWGRVPGGL